MKIKELFESKTSLDDLVKRLEKVGGKIYGEITKGGSVGKLGVNGSGKTKVYFAFYPDGTSQRFESLPTSSQLKSGWTANDLRDPETAKKEKDAVEKDRKTKDREAKFTEEIRLSFKEIADVCALEEDNIADAYVDGPREKGTKVIGGKDVAYANYTIYLYREGESAPNGKTHDPVHFRIWRDSKNPEKYHADQTDY